ncbi:MAG: ATP-dependent Clp protease adaptor ClpS [Polyangiaceae bacterium]
MPSSARGQLTASAPGGPTRPPTHAPGLAPGEDVDLEERQKTATPKRFKVIFHNDDFTTMEYVIEVLRRHFHKSETEALHVMLTVHKKGRAVAGVYPRDVAETKVSEVMLDARDRGHPLLVTAEPE